MDTFGLVISNRIPEILDYLFYIAKELDEPYGKFRNREPGCGVHNEEENCVLKTTSRVFSNNFLDDNLGLIGTVGGFLSTGLLSPKLLPKTFQHIPIYKIKFISINIQYLNIYSGILFH